MKVLVTGGTGFAGSALCRRLAGEGHDVVAVHRRPGPAADALRQAGVHTVLGSVTDGALMHRLTERCDRVYHLAAAFRQVSIGEKAYFETNVEGTRRVMEAALERAVPSVVHCSTIGVHGHVEQPPATEDAPIAPLDYYQQSKWEGEQVAMGYAARGLPVTIVRPAAIYGPGDEGRLLMMFRRVARGRFVFLGDGSAHLHTVYVENLVDGMLLASEVPGRPGRPYIIADEHSMSLRELVLAIAEALQTRVKLTHVPYGPAYALGALTELLCKPLSIEPPIFRRRVKLFRCMRSFDITRARQELRYEPRVGIQRGLAHTGAWYRAHGLL